MGKHAYKGFKNKHFKAKTWPKLNDLKLNLKEKQLESYRLIKQRLPISLNQKYYLGQAGVSSFSLNVVFFKKAGLFKKYQICMTS